MIRVYLDWNIISYLKLPEYLYIVDFINENKEHLLFLYSPAHFSDLMKSSQEHPNFQKDLETLEWLCGKHHIRWENDNFAALFGTPSYFFEEIKHNVVDETAFDLEKQFQILEELSVDLPASKVLIDNYKKNLQSTKFDLQLDETSRKVFEAFFPNLDLNASLWDVSKTFGLSAQAMINNKKIWLDLRKYIEESGGKLESNAGNWEKNEVITKVGDFLKKISPTPMSFYEYIQINYKDREKPSTLYELYQSAYLTLDLIGYKSDSLPKQTDSLMNITTDVEHSFLAQTCDIFVLEDKKMKAKTEALYHYFNIHTSVVSLEEMVLSIEKKLHDKSLVSPIDIMEHIYDMFLEEINPLIDGTTVPFNKPLENKLFNFFDFAHFEFEPNQSILIITFSKDEFKYSNFLYFTEKEYLLNQIENLFQIIPENEHYKAWREQYIHNHEFEIQRYGNSGVVGALWKEEKYAYPLLTMGVRLHTE
jgi:hypothetical protein